MFEIIVMTKSASKQKTTVLQFFFLDVVGSGLCLMNVSRCPSMWYLYQLEHSDYFRKTRRTCPECVIQPSHRKAPFASVSTLPTFVCWYERRPYLVCSAPGRYSVGDADYPRELPRGPQEESPRPLRCVSSYLKTDGSQQARPPPPP